MRRLYQGKREWSVLSNTANRLRERGATVKIPDNRNGLDDIVGAMLKKKKNL